MDSQYSVLILDEDEDICYVLRDILTKKGFDTFISNGFAQLKEIINDRFFNVALVDFKPNGELLGVDVLNLIKSAWLDTEVIIITGYATVESAIQVIDAEVFAYLHKPIEVDQIVITVSMALEKQRLKVENRRLYQELRERAEKLREYEQKYRILEELINSEKIMLGELIFEVAHKINNPLTVIIGYIQLLLAYSDLNEADRKNIEKVNTEAQKVGDIIENLLSFARQRESKKVPVSINELIEEAIILKSCDLGFKNIIVMKDLTPNLPMTVVDPSQIQQVFLNMITNAEQAMFEANGKGILLIKTAVKKGINQSEADKVEISFMDNGPGIPKDIMKDIFNPFFTTKSIGKGLGLGLFISYRIIKQHEGQIYIESTEGKGTTIFIELPISEENLPLLVEKK